MSNHSNKKVKKHIESSETLSKKMEALTETLETNISKQFKKDMGVEIPTAVDADVREIDIAMVYSTDPTTSEYMNGANEILQAAFTGTEVDVISKALDYVGEVVDKIIGSGTIEIGLKSSSGKVTSGSGKKYIVACYASTQICTAKDWATVQDFYTSYYCFVVFEKK